MKDDSTYIICRGENLDEYYRQYTLESAIVRRDNINVIVAQTMLSMKNSPKTHYSKAN